ncbi:unnamed protein product [Coffea canephora]|uniref:DH200=94 genomic scaffold, scaffold_454 n=1 Tax=Coffea canephora TaxID=49390 RepID=A0A068VFM9_COFCA|nr:unnamed protein product [Coffea canephora]
MGVDRGLFKLNIFFRQPCGRSSYNVSPVVDDETLEIMYDVWNEIAPYIAELYIEKEKIFQNPRVTGTFISPNTNCGPMMSLVHACMDPTRFRPYFSTAIPETASVSQFPYGDCVRDSIAESCCSYGFNFTAGPSHCNSPLANDSEHDVEDVEESESVDVIGSNSDGEIEQRGVHQDRENQQSFYASSILSYAPRGLKFFFNIETEKWCLTHDGEHRWGILTTNISESYNNVLRGARHLPIRACIDLTFHRTVELFKTRREDARHYRNLFPPKIWRKFKNSDQKAGSHRVVEFDGSSEVYKVVTNRRVDGKGGNTQTVKYFEKTCSCGKWQCYRLPCSHVLAVCRHRRDSLTSSFLAIPFLFVFFLFPSAESYGAKSDGRSDSTNSFLSAWPAACASAKPATIFVPRGRFLVGGASFLGQNCKNNAITICINGTLVAPSDYNVLGYTGNWLKFERTNGLSIYGGTLDGQGTGIWACKNSGKNCPQGARVVLDDSKIKFLFQHAVMVNVQNPIIIDQNYCPNRATCPGQGSGVRISGVTYQDVHGTSATKVAVNFDCSKKYPCSRISLEDVNLTYKDQPAMASCVNAGGSSSGLVQPKACL